MASDAEVLERAFPVIAREGFDSFTLAQVRRATGLSPAALIKRFGTKKRLAVLARDQGWRRLLAAFDTERTAARGLAGIDALVRAIARSVDSLRLDEHLRRLSEDAAHPTLRRSAGRFFARTREALRTFLAEAVESGELVGEVDAAELAAQLEAMIQGAIFQYGFVETDDGIETWLRRRIHGLLAPHRGPVERR